MPIIDLAIPVSINSSLYTNMVDNPGNNPAGQKVSMHRPRSEEDNNKGVSGFMLSLRDAPFICWLETEGYTVEYCTDLDLHEDTELLSHYHLLLSVGHDEYWSQDMRTYVEMFIARGGNVAFFSGNTCWWCIHYVDPGKDGHPTAFVCATDHRLNYSNFTAEPHIPVSLPLSHWPPALDQWWKPIPHGLGKPENTLTGVSHRNAGVRHGAKLGYTVQHAEHWVYEGTGLKDGQVFGQEAELVGYECDGAAYRLDDQGIAHPIGLDGTPSTFIILALADFTTSVAESTDKNIAAKQTEIIYSSSPDWGWVCPPREQEVEMATGQKRAATMGIYTAPGGGTVFTAATVDWAEVLGTRREPQVEQITRNVLSRLMRKQPAGLGVFNQVDDQRALIPLAEHKDWSPFLRAIVPGSFANQSWLQLLFYDPVNGVGEFYASNGRGLLTLLKRNEGWGSLWSLIIPGSFSLSKYSDLLFYDPVNGIGEFYTCNGDGTITLLRRYQDWGKTWSLIIPGVFSDSGYTDLLFYDPVNGVGEFYTCNGAGTITLLKRYEGWDKIWKTIVPLDYLVTSSGSSRSALLFYRQTQ